MSDTRNSITGGSSLRREPVEDNGQLEGRKITLGKKPIFIVFMVLGVGAFGVAGVGLAAFGGSQNWWSLGALTNLPQVYSIVMMSVGGGGGILLLSSGIIGLVVLHIRKPHISRPEGRLLSALQFERANTALDASYDHEDESGILDLVYCDNDLGFGCVVDGTGHSNPRMQKGLREHFDPFIKAYAEGLKSLNTYEELVEYFQEQVEKLEGQFKNRELSVNREKVLPTSKMERLSPEDLKDIGTGTFLDVSYKPAMTFVQLVRKEDQLFLLTAQVGDTMVVVEMPDGELITTQKSCFYGLGDDLRRVPIQSFDITGARRVIGFSDGIGEFLTFDELKEVIISTESDQLFDQLKEKVISQREVDPSTSAANGANFKSYDKDKVNEVGELTRSDDMSLFVLDI